MIGDDTKRAAALGRGLVGVSRLAPTTTVERLAHINDIHTHHCWRQMTDARTGSVQGVFTCYRIVSG